MMVCMYMSSIYLLRIHFQWSLAESVCCRKTVVYKLLYIICNRQSISWYDMVKCNDLSNVHYLRLNVALLLEQIHSVYL